MFSNSVLHFPQQTAVISDKNTNDKFQHLELKLWNMKYLCKYIYTRNVSTATGISLGAGARKINYQEKIVEVFQFFFFFLRGVGVVLIFQ